MTKIYDGIYTGQKIFGDDGKEYFRFVISTSDIDRAGDIMVLDGIDTSEYEQTGSTVFYNHDYTNRLPIGHSKLVRSKDAIFGDVWFDEVDELSRTIKGKVEAKTITNASIGFEVIEYENRPITPEEKAKSKRNFKSVQVLTKTLLHEWSIVAIPMNIYANLQSKMINDNKFKQDLINLIEGVMDIEEKKGSVLSKKNRDSLKTALSLIKDVLNEADDEQAEDAKSIDVEEIKTLVTGLTEQIETLKSDIDEIKTKTAEKPKQKKKLTDIYNQ